MSSNLESAEVTRNTEELSVKGVEARELQAMVRRLRRENAGLRHEVQRLQVYRTMAYRDHLTGLHNRRYFQERMREERARASRSTVYSFAVVLVDVDDFKAVNDTLGHTTGDEVLVAVAKFMESSVREVDIVCRLGGDEFALLLPNTDEAGCRIVVERLRHGLKEAQPSFPCPIMLSLGAAAHPPGPNDCDGLMAQADTAMYLDKRRHKARRGRRSA